VRDRTAVERVAARLAGGPLGAERRAALCAIAETAAAANAQAWLVGGAVRDAWLGLDPGEDLDVVVEGDAGAIARALAAVGGDRIVVHRRFGTATWQSGRLAIDVVTARAEAYERPGGLPSVRAGTLADDLARRDFALNAMAIALRVGPPGASALVDPFGGASDLQNGLIRILHDRSFVDDPTRILRAARFAARLGFALEPATHALARAAVAAGALATVSRARIDRELAAVFREARPGRALAALVHLGVLEPTAGLGAGRGPRAVEPRRPSHGLVDERDERIADALPAAWSRLVRGAPRLALAARPSAPTRRAIWAAGRALEATRTPWRPVAVREAAIVDGAGWRRAAALRGAAPSRLARALAGRPGAAVAAAWLLAGHPEARRALRRHAELPARPCPIDGTDVMALGIPPGPRIGRVLDAVDDAWRDGAVADRTAALRLAATLALASADGP